MASSAKRPILVLESSFPVVCLSTVSVVDSVVIIIITRILRIVTPQPGPACLASSANRPILFWKVSFPLGACLLCLSIYNNNNK